MYIIDTLVKRWPSSLLSEEKQVKQQWVTFSLLSGKGYKEQ